MISKLFVPLLSLALLQNNAFSMGWGWSDLDPTNKNGKLRKAAAECDPTNPNTGIGSVCHAISDGLAECDPTNPNTNVGNWVCDHHGRLLGFALIGLGPTGMILGPIGMIIGNQWDQLNSDEKDLIKGALSANNWDVSISSNGAEHFHRPLKSFNVFYDNPVIKDRTEYFRSEQTEEFTCSAHALNYMIKYSFALVNKTSPSMPESQFFNEIVKGVPRHNIFGNEIGPSLSKLLSYANSRVNGLTFKSEINNLGQLLNYIELTGEPVMALVRVGTKTVKAEFPEQAHVSIPQFHWVVVTGYDKETDRVTWVDGNEFKDKYKTPISVSKQMSENINEFSQKFGWSVGAGVPAAIIRKSGILPGLVLKIDKHLGIDLGFPKTQNSQYFTTRVQYLEPLMNSFQSRNQIVLENVKFQGAPHVTNGDYKANPFEEVIIDDVDYIGDQTYLNILAKGGNHQCLARFNISGKLAQKGENPYCKSFVKHLEENNKIIIPGVKLKKVDVKNGHYEANPFEHFDFEFGYSGNNTIINIYVKDGWHGGLARFLITGLK